MATTWTAFKDKVLEDLPINRDREGIQTLLSNLIRNYVIELEILCPQLGAGQITLLNDTDVFVDGLANYGDMPDGAHIREAWVLMPTDDSGSGEPDPCERELLDPFPWRDRFKMICDKDSVYNYKFAIDPFGTQFYSRPKLDETMQLALHWDGIKRTFSDADVVPFPLDMAEVVALYVDAQLIRRIDKDMNLYAAAMREYGRKRRLFVLERRELTTFNRGG